MAELKPIIEQSFIQYAGAVLQSRALVDVRDCLKPSARQIFYCLHTDKFLHNKPFKKTLKAVGSASRMYIHGDSSLVGIIMRASQEFAMRYPLIETEGNNGSLMISSNWAHQRYTSTRLSQLSEWLFKDIDKNTISHWYDNYDDTEKYPSVLPTKGFYNIVNGTMGIGIGMSSSIPQFNLREVNEALIKLLWNPEISCEELICLPDFATGGYLLNKNEVIESLKQGTGKSCKLRSQIEFDEKDNCLIVTEIPYGMYTNTICKELEEILESEDNPGIDRFNDLTGSTPLIKIYLYKNSNVTKVLKYLYKNTSLQYYYSINMTMLNDGKYPKVFNWKEALESFLIHEKEIYYNSFNYDLVKIKARLHILEGLFICLANIDEIVKIIKGSISTSAASNALQKKFNLSEIQAKAILDTKLSRLAHIEVEKLQNESNELKKDKKRIEEILENEILFNKEIEKDLLKVSLLYSDDRRTKIINLENNTENDEDLIEKKNLLINFTNLGNLYISESSTLLLQKRQNTIKKIKLEKNEIIIDSFISDNTNNMLLFSNTGKIYNYSLSKLIDVNKININEIITISKDEYITKIFSSADFDKFKYAIFVTKNGYIKKSLLSDYVTTTSRGIIGTKLYENDSIINIFFINNENIGVLNSLNHFIIFNSIDINPTGRNTYGVKLMNLNFEEEILYSDIISNNSTHLITLTNTGLIKRTPLSDYKITNKNAKGVTIQKINDNSKVNKFISIYNEDYIIAVDETSTTKLLIRDIASTSRNACGLKIGKNSKELNFIGIFKV